MSRRYNLITLSNLELDYALTLPNSQDLNLICNLQQVTKTYYLPTGSMEAITDKWLMGRGNLTTKKIIQNFK